MSEEETALVTCGTSKGEFTMKFIREWSPNGYDRAVELFERGFYDDSHFFRVEHDFLVQFGISYTEDEDLIDFADEEIEDDPQLDPPIEFKEGTISFAGHGEDSRSTHLFIAYEGLPDFGEEDWETPIGFVENGMKETVFKFYEGYGADDDGPEQWKLNEEGLSYVQREFPLLDKFHKCTVVRNKAESRELLEVRHSLATSTEDVVSEIPSTKHQVDSSYISTTNMLTFSAFGLLALTSLLVRKSRNK